MARQVDIYDKLTKRMVKVTAHSCGVKGLVVHPRYRYENRGWDITHLASGMYIDLSPYSPFQDRTAAIRAAKAIAEAADWTEDAWAIADTFAIHHYVYRALEREFGQRW